MTLGRMVRRPDTEENRGDPAATAAAGDPRPGSSSAAGPCAGAAPIPSSRRTGVLSPGRLPFRSGRAWPWGLLLLLAVLAAYGPVWRAGFVWDDSSMLTANPCIAGPLGLRQIWTTHFADICPLALSALWLEHALWGFSPAPYHVVNVLLHAAGAILLWGVLRRLRVPGAWLGAALWALHPVEVESVAWVAELKNTLSGVFFLGAVFFYLRWRGARDPGGRARAGWPLYGWCLLCAALAMASKSSTVVLPAVLGLCVWWLEGRVRWRRAVSLGPLVLLAAAASVLSLWTQRASLALATDARWARPWPGRLVAAGEAVWFYLGKLLWPHPLISIYPRWHVDAGRWPEWLPLLAVVAALSLLGWGRGSPWGRAGFFAGAYFLVALAPVLGWFDNTGFRYSLVFDHFQYLASMGPLALAGAGIVRLARLTLPGRAWWPSAPAAAVLLVLGTLCWQRSEAYRDEETFWTDTVAKNPDCWSGHGNLGSALLLQGQLDAARAQYEQALAINPDYAEARSNLGVILLRQGKVEEATAQVTRAVASNPHSAEAHNNLGMIFLRQGKITEAIAQVEQAVAINPYYAEAHSNLGNALFAQGRADEAIAEYGRALAINPEYAFVYFNLGNAFFARGQVDEAIAEYEKALAIDRDYAEAHSNLGNAFLAKRQPDAAIAQYQKALTIRADYVEAHYNLGIACLRTARFDEAAVQFQEALRLAPGYPNVETNLATARTLARRARGGR